MSKCHHYSRRMIRELPTNRVGDVWRTFTCNACGEHGVLRSGDIAIKWQGETAPVDKLSTHRTYAVPFASRQKGKVRRD